MDKVPTSFKRDLLVHEAHNHPYIERIGAMYLLRLRDGKGFGCVEGTAWRSLFVCALMPWIVKHRVNNNEDAPLLGDVSMLAGASGRRASVVARSHRIGRASIVQSIRTSGRAPFLPSEDALRSSRRESLLHKNKDEAPRLKRTMSI